jgi:hypothetical protein
MRYKGGVISATPPTTSTSAATGVWTLVQQLQAQEAGAWPVPISSARWIGTLTSSVQTRTITVDAAGFVYMAGYASSSDAFITKYSSSGSIQWQKKITSGGQARGITVDSSGNVYVILFYGNTSFVTIKLNSSGVIQWQKEANGAGNEFAYGISVDASGNVYVAGWTTTTSPFAAIVFKYNNSGTFQWGKSIGSGVNTECYCVTTDTSGNVYIAGRNLTEDGTRGNVFVIKLDSAGNIQWQSDIGDGTAVDYGYGIKTDSSGNVYVTGIVSNNMWVGKFNSSGAVVWQKKLTSTVQSSDVFLDSSNNVYVVGYGFVSSVYRLVIAKYNNSGTIQWQRMLGTSSGDSYGYGIAIDSFNNICVCGLLSVSSVNNAVFARLPSDGSLTGTYSVGAYSFVYEASSFTDSSTSFSVVSTLLTAASASLTQTTSALAFTDTTFTSSVTTL